MRFTIPESYHELIGNACVYTQFNFPDTESILRGFGLNSMSFHAQLPMFYVVDYVNQKYLHVDPSIKMVLGYEPEDLCVAGPLHYTSLWHNNDYMVFDEHILPDSIRFLRTLSPVEYPKFSFSFNHRIKNFAGEFRTLLQRSTYFLSADNGYPLAAIGVSFDISHFKENTSIIHTIERIDRNFNNLSNDCLHKKIYYPDQANNLLTKREIEVLHFLYQGNSSKLIAEKLNLSVNTVNNHRKNILQKTASRNTAELLYYAKQHQLLQT